MHEGGRLGAGAATDCRAFRSIFQEDWWLQAVAGRDLDRVSVAENGRDVAHLYFVPRRVLGCRLLRMPPYTRTLGPVFENRGGADMPRTHRREICSRLVTALPPHDYFEQVLEPADESGLVFALNGFAVGASFTVRIPAGLAADDLWQRMDSRRRRRIRDRQKDLVVERHGDVARFVALARREYSEAINYHRYDILAAAFEAAHGRGQAAVLSARRDDGSDASSAVLLWDAQTMYFWLAARDHDAGRGAKTLVLWEALNLAQSLGVAFDFDGFFSLSGANFILSFGFPTQIRPVVTRARPMARALLAGRALAAGLAWRRRQPSRLAPV